VLPPALRVTACIRCAATARRSAIAARRDRCSAGGMLNRRLVARRRWLVVGLAWIGCVGLGAMACRDGARTGRGQALTADAGSGSACDPPVDCPPGTELVLSDTGELVCGPPPPPACDPTAPCEAPLQCFDGACVDPGCATSADCPAPLVCVDHACAQPSCDACPAGFHCVTEGFGGDLDHACVPDHCTSDHDCPGGLRCIAGSCTDRTPCTSSAQCALGTCIAGACHIECRSASDCAAGQVCDPVLAICSLPCGRDADCGAGHLCTGSLCQPDPCGGCMPDEVCAAGRCMACDSFGGQGYGGGCGGGIDAGVPDAGSDAGSRPDAGADGRSDAGSGSGSGSGSDSGSGSGSGSGPGSGSGRF
jgi:hypothetical protein